MKKILLTILAGFLLAGCNACAPKPEITGDITHEYDHYLTQFNSDLARLGYRQIDFSQLVIRNTDNLVFDGENHQGYCFEITVRHAGPAAISFDRHFKYNTDQIKGLYIYHEVGHCFLGLGHAPGIMTAGNLGYQFSINDFSDDTKRLKLLKDMLQASSYR